jgi:hyperosmotically inducible protein
MHVASIRARPARPAITRARRRAVVVLLCAVFAVAASAQQKDPRTRRIEIEVQNELLSLPYYGIFDLLAFKVEPGATVRLLGQVVRPTLKADAERRVKGISGIEQVINDIEVLPVSPGDDRIRLDIARNIYRTESLERYGFQSQPPIHIIVKNGRVRLEGSVDSESDKAVAALKAREVGGVFEVTNNLTVDR